MCFEFVQARHRALSSMLSIDATQPATMSLQSMQDLQYDTDATASTTRIVNEMDDVEQWDAVVPGPLPNSGLAIPLANRRKSSFQRGHSFDVGSEPPAAESAQPFATFTSARRNPVSSSSSSTVSNDVNRRLQTFV